MDAKDVLERAISKAIDGGLDDDGVGYYFSENYNDYWDGFNITEGWWKREEHDMPAHRLSINEVIFNHDFAKALWGDIEKEISIEDADTWRKPQPLMGGLIDYPYNEGADITFNTPLWKYNLQMMVIAEDPIKYLGDNI